MAVGVMNAFLLFLVVVAGAVIQHSLNVLSSRRQAKNALKVMQIEIAYSLEEVKAFLDHVQWLRRRISSGQISSEDFAFAMHRFDYSSVGPLSNSGYFHMLLGAQNLRK